MVESVVSHVQDVMCKKAIKYHIEQLTSFEETDSWMSLCEETGAENFLITLRIVCVLACARLCVRARVFVSVCVHVHACVCDFSESV